MTFTLLARRSSTPGRAPTTSQLSLGELSVNTNDGLIYYVKSTTVGNTVTNSIVCIGPVPGTANALTTAVNIAVSGAVTGTISFNGANSVTIPTVLANSGVTAGTYSLLTVNAQGLVTSGSQISNTTITTALGYIPVNRAGDTMTGGLTISPATGSFPFTYLANTAGIYSTAIQSNSAVGGADFGWNFSNGNQEVDIFNPYLTTTGATGGFVFYQQLSNTAVQPLLKILGNGLVTAVNISSNQFSSANTVGIATFGTFNGTAILTPGIQSYANATVIFGNGNTIVTPSGTITTVTQSLGDKTTNVATTAFVTNAIGQYVSLSGATMTGDLNVANTASNANGGATRLHIDADTSGVDTARFSVVVSPQPFSNTGSAAVALDMFGGGGMQVFANTATTSSLWTVNYSVDALAGNNLGGNINFVPWNDSGVPQIQALKMYRSNGVVAFGNTITTVTQPSTDNTTNVATTAFVQSLSTNYISNSGGSIDGLLLFPLNSQSIVANGAINSFSTIASTGGFFNLAPTTNTINYTQVNVYDGNTGGYYINNAAGQNRWSIVTSATANVATNTYSGSDLYFLSWVGNPSVNPTNVLTLYRSNSLATFGGTVTTVTQPNADNTTNVATTAFVQNQFSTTTAGTYGAVVINSKGQVTTGLPTNYSGDVTGSTSGANATLTLNTVNSNVGSFGSATIVPVLTVNAKGLITAVTNTNIVFPVTSVAGQTGAVTGGTFTSAVVHSGQVTAVTQPASDNTSNVATTAFVKSANASQIGRYLIGTIGALSSSYVYSFSTSTPTPSASWGKLWSATFTPSSVNSKIEIQYSCTVSVSAAMQTYFVVTRNSNVIGMTGIYSASATNPQPLSQLIFDAPASTSAATYICYYAQNVTGTTYINQLSTTSFGGAMQSPFSILDI